MIASGRRIQTPADDPADFRRSIEIQTSQRAAQQFKDSIRQLKTRADGNFETATQLQTLVGRSSEIAIRASRAYNQSELNIMAGEVNNLLEQAVAYGNRQQGGQFLFGGTSLQPGDLDGAAPYVPFRVTRVAGQITLVDYRGNEVVSQVNIDPVSTFPANVVGQSTVSPGNPRGLFIDGAVGPGQVNVFTALINLRNRLQAGAPDPITSMNELRPVENNVANVIGFVAANMGRLQLTDETHTRSLITDEETLGKITNADLAETIASLRQTQIAFEGALQSGARILSQTLLNFLR